MAHKPLVVKLGVGQATFVYMPQEEAEKYAKLLESAYKSGDNLEAKNFAVGLHQNPETKNWELAILRYNSLTKEAIFDTITNVGTLKNHANDEFKKTVMKLKIV